jgi:hypothetical protein
LNVRICLNRTPAPESALQLDHQGPETPPLGRVVEPGRLLKMHRIVQRSEQRRNLNSVRQGHRAIVPYPRARSVYMTAGRG